MTSAGPGGIAAAIMAALANAVSVLRVPRSTPCRERVSHVLDPRFKICRKWPKVPILEAVWVAKTSVQGCICIGTNLGDVGHRVTGVTWTPKNGPK